LITDPLLAEVHAEMPTQVCRLLPFATADGAHNMAADEALLESAGGGTASLRFYGWSEPALSLGYFQAHETIAKNQRLARLPFVRRPTGGDAIVHHFDLTYALALPAGRPWQTAESWMTRMHQIIAASLGSLGVSAQLHQPCAEPAERFQGVLCFQHLTPCDVLVGESKVVGSAQRRRKGILLQHGSILLTVSTFAPLVPGIRELSGQGLSAPVVRDAVVAEFGRQAGWTIENGDWTDAERRSIRELILSRYTQDSWNRKR
jgi:lipoyl(octanoyl) transferase